MSYSAIVLLVMIASPSDVPEERNIVERAIHSWNASRARRNGIILQPWRSETSAVPVMGRHPQKLINAQGVDDSDIVFALFGGRLGSVTPDAVSGTAEEIHRALEMGKPVHVYFSTASLPHDIDTAQLDSLRAFKSEMQSCGLLGEFSNSEQLTHEVWKAIEHDIAATTLPATRSDKAEPSAVDFLVQPHQEREISGHTSKGDPRYTTKHWVDVTNTGLSDAEAVRLHMADDQCGIFFLGPHYPTTIHAGQTRRFPVAVTFQRTGPAILRVQWVESGGQKQRDFHIG